MKRQAAQPTLIDLTYESAPTGRTSIICTDNPEWGTWGVMRHCKETDGPGWMEIRGRSGDRVLHHGEFRFWKVVAK